MKSQCKKFKVKTRRHSESLPPAGLINRPCLRYLQQTRLHPFACSWLYNATAVRGALWWFRKSHSVNYANHQHSPFARRRHDVSNPLSFGKSFMKIRSAVPENGCLIVLVDGKKQKKTKKCKKNICKTYTHPPPTGRRLRKLGNPLRRNWPRNMMTGWHRFSPSACFF